MVQTWIVCACAALATLAASSDPLVDKLGSGARATYLNMDEAHRELVRANLKKAHVSEADQGNVVVSPTGVIALVDDHLEMDESEADEDTAGSRRRRSSFDATPSGYTSTGNIRFGRDQVNVTPLE